MVQTADDASEHTEEWMFPGWMTCQLFGPRAHFDYQSPLFSLGDWSRNEHGKKSKVEAEPRQEKKELLKKH